MLKIVRPGDPGQAPRPRKRSSLCLTAEESARLALVLKNLRRTFTTWIALGDAMGVHPDVLCQIATGKKRGSPGVLLRAARVSGLPLDRILSASLAVVNTCPHCGRGSE